MHGIQPKLLPSFAVASDNAREPNSVVEKETKSTRGILDVYFYFLLVRPRGFVTMAVCQVSVRNCSSGKLRKDLNKESRKANELHFCKSVLRRSIIGFRRGIKPTSTYVLCTRETP